MGFPFHRRGCSPQPVDTDTTGVKAATNRSIMLAGYIIGHCCEREKTAVIISARTEAKWPRTPGNVPAAALDLRAGLRKWSITGMTGSTRRVVGVELSFSFQTALSFYLNTAQSQYHNMIQWQRSVKKKQQRTSIPPKCTMKNWKSETHRL